MPRRPFLPALSAQQTCCCCGCPDILQPLCSSSAAAQILVPCSAAAQMLCLPCFCCCCLHPDTLHCPTLLHLIYPTGNSFLSRDTQSQLYRKSGDGVLNSSSEGGWVGGGLKFSFPQHFAMHSANKKKVVSLSIAQEYLKIACSFLQLTAVANPLKGIRPLNHLPSVSMYFPK